MFSVPTHHNFVVVLYFNVLQLDHPPEYLCEPALALLNVHDEDASAQDAIDLAKSRTKLVFPQEKLFSQMFTR